MAGKHGYIPVEFSFNAGLLRRSVEAYRPMAGKHGYIVVEFSLNAGIGSERPQSRYWERAASSCIAGLDRVCSF